MSETPALDLWRSRMGKGWGGQRAEAPSSWVYDNLWRAACYEAQALQFHGQGMTTLAEDSLAAAQAVLAETT